MEEKTERVMFMNDPLRPVCWRWEAAKALASSAGKRKKGSDKLIEDAADFVLAIRRRTAGLTAERPRVIPMEEIRREYPDISTASDIMSGGSFIKYAIEAYVMARAEAEEIARRIGCPVSVIKTYEDLFFDIRSRLDNDLFVINATMGTFVAGGKVDEKDVVWKALGYFYGKDVVDAFVSIKPISPEVLGAIRDMISSQLSRRVVSTLVSRNVDNEKISDIIVGYSKLIDSTKEQVKAGSEVTNLLGSVKIVMYPDPEKISDAEKANKAEPMAKEQLRRLFGKK